MGDGDPVDVNVVGSQGTFTPNDVEPNPSNIPGDESFTMVWDAATLTWIRAITVGTNPNVALPRPMAVGVTGMDPAGGPFNRPVTAYYNFDTAIQGIGLDSRSFHYLWNGRGGVPGWVAARVVDTFKTVQAAAAGNTALWTPTAGQKFRLMRYLVTVTGNAILAAGAVLTVSLFDGGAGATGQAHDIFVPAAATSLEGFIYNSGWIDLGNGVLSAAANNVLNVNLSAALTAGNVRVIACGTEE